MSARRTYTFTRTGGHTEQYCEHRTLHQCRQLIAWCCTDNLNMTRTEASGHAGQFIPGEPLTIGEYTFQAGVES